MARTGRTGADAIFIAIRHICHVLVKYQAKFEAVITAAQTAGAITSIEASTIRTFLATTNALCVALEHLATYSGF